MQIENLKEQSKSESKLAFSFLANSLLDFLYKKPDTLQIPVLAIGFFYCFAGMNFKQVSFSSMIFFFLVSIAYQKKAEIIKFVAKFDPHVSIFFNFIDVNTYSPFVTNFVPKNYHFYFLSDKPMVCLVGAALIATVLICYILKWFNFVSTTGLTYHIYSLCESKFARFGENCKIYCLIFSLAASAALSYIKGYFIDIFLLIVFCFVGSCLIIAIAANIIKVFGSSYEFFNKMIKLDPDTLQDPLLYFIFTLTILGFFFQRRILKV